MNIEKLWLHGSFLITYDVFHDNRGSFHETFNWEKFMDAGLPHRFQQDNLTYNLPNVLRGLHIQKALPQGKLMRCLKGVIYDVFVDLRPDSPTFKRWMLVELNEHRKRALYVPEGCAHGFYSPVESIVYYKCTTLYDKASDGGINPFDPELQIAWPEKKAILSEKDLNLPTMSTWLKETYG